jgi:DNA polymerase
MLIGEQPGDQEDLQGKPFVGPAGQMLDRALRDIGLDRRKVYVTNAVKHFKWEPRGKRRLHKKPVEYEIVACRRWLDAELAQVQPELVVTLGATAGASLLGKAFKVTKLRGHLIEEDELRILPTIHPSMILRVPGAGARELAYREFTHDLEKIFSLLTPATLRQIKLAA